MPAKTTTTLDLAVDEVAWSEATELVDTTGDRKVVGVSLELDDGERVVLPNRLGTFVADLVRSMANGAGVSTTVLPDELTTTVAADVIGISRPTLMKLIARGDIPAHTVGTHHRLRREDVLLARTVRRAARERAAAELLAAGEAFD